MSENSMSSTIISRANIAVNRFGYGAREDELELAEPDPKKWLIDRLLPISFGTFQPHSDEILIEHAKYRQENMQQKRKQSNNSQADTIRVNNKMNQNRARHALRSMSADIIQRAIASSNSVSWRLLDFFSNHFSVSAKGHLMIGLAATLEREAIAPNLFGNFEDMLLAVEQHPAMLIYLNNERSFAANSKMAKRRKIGLNENLAREILELHTLGVDGGYSQEDIIELTKGITGWSVVHYRESGVGFTFRSSRHEPGIRTLLGKKYAQQGITQGTEMLRDLAIHPLTAKYVCYKLAHHFVSENPPVSLLDKMEATWLRTGGNIKEVMLSVFNADEAWLNTAQKFKTPREFVISTARALAPTKIKDKVLLGALHSLGQEPFKAGSPAGYSDDANDWLGASALMARVDWSTLILGRYESVNSEKVMNLALGSSVSKLTYHSVLRAESRQQSMTLLLMSPEFQRR